MNRRIIRWVAIFQIGLTVLTGCSPTRPFYARNNPSLANYLDQAMSIEYADVEVDSLPEATQTFEPFSHERMPDKFRDWSLEDCMSIALQNAKIIVATPGLNLQSGSMAPSLLSAQPGQMPSVYDPALVALTGNTQPLAIDSQGNRVSPRGSVRANQVGGVEHALSEFDAQYSTIFGYNTTDRPRNVGQGNIFNPQLFQAKDATLQNAISKRLATGTVVTARANTVYSKNNVPASGNAVGSTNFGRAVPSDYTASIEAQISQPLMRGRGALVNRIPVVLARMNEENATHQFEVNVRNLLRDIEHAYWDLYLGYRSVETQQKAYGRAMELWKLANTRDDTLPATVLQAEGRVAQFKAQLHIAINGSPIPGNDPLGLVGRERLLREKLGLAATDGWFIRPSDMPTEARIQFDWETVLSESLARNTDLRIAKWSIKQRELEHMSAKNQLLPQLDIVGTYRWLGVGDTLISADRTGLAFPNPGSNAVENLTNGDFQEVGARIEYTPAPIGSRREKANINATMMSLKKSYEELKEKERSMSMVLSNAWTNLHSSFISAADFLDQLQAHTAEIDRYEEQILKGNYGESGQFTQSFDQILRAEELRARAEQQFYQSVVEYNKSIVNIHAVKGSIFDLNNVSLGEGAWVEKAYWDAEQRAQERAGGIYFDYGYTRPGVVSRGPMEVGGATESNISDMTPRQIAPIVQPEEVEAKELEAADEKKDSILDRQDSDTKSTGRRRDGSQRPAIARPNNGQAASVKPASSEAPVIQADQFQWGELGLNNSKPALRTAGANNLKQVPQVNNAVQGNQPAPIVTGLPVNDLRATTTNAPTNQLQKQPATTQSSTGQPQAASIQWRVRN